jgi:hypothetical protein
MPSLPRSEQQQRMIDLVHEIYDAWEVIEHILFNIFAHLSKGPYSESRALYYSLRNHRARQEMIQALAADIFVNEQDKLKELVKCTCRAGKAAGKRNEVAHGAWAITPDRQEYRRMRVMNDPRLTKPTEFSERDLKERVDYMRQVARELTDYYLGNRTDWYRRRFDYCKGIAARGPEPKMAIL